MRDHLIQCPLCQNEIPFDQAQCPYCGALMAPGPTRGTPILKGVVCLKCGEKNYSYDECAHCGHAFSKACPGCGAEMRLSDQQCPKCNLSVRKFSAARRKVDTASARRQLKLPGLDRKWTFIVPIGIAVLVAIAMALFALCAPEEKAKGPDAPKAGQERAVDSNGDGKTDHIDVYGENGRVAERRFDADNDDRYERIEFYDESGVIRRAQADENKDKKYEKTEIYGAGGKLRLAYFYLGADPLLPTKIESYNTEGKLVEQWIDSNGDYVFDQYARYDARQRLVIAGSDSKKAGFIDLYVIYRGQKKVFQRQTDANGDGVIEKIETLNATGVRVILEEDTDANGLIDKKVFYDANGTLRWEQFDSDGDGIFDTFKSYTETGKFARTGTDTNGDSRADTWE